MTKDATETAAQHKLRSAQVTACARFNAAHRLRRHESVSLFSISFCSLAVVVISMLGPFGVQLQVHPNEVNLATAATSLMILVISIIITGRRYGERADKMHSCAVEINAIARKMRSAVEKDDLNEVDALAEQYEVVLKANENHIDIDYRAAQIQRFVEHYKIKWHHRLRNWIEVKWDLAGHAVPLIAVVGIIFVLLQGASFDSIQK